MSLFDKALNRIENNRHSNHNCIPFTTSLPRFSENIPGIQQKRYYLVAGASGAGKTQFTDNTFVFSPYNFIKENDTDVTLKIFYYSFELDKETKITQWMSRRLYEQYGIRTGINILQSIGKNRLSDDLYMAVMETRRYFEELEDILYICDEVTMPEKVIKDIHTYANENGKIVNNVWVPNKPKEYVEIIVDHYSLLNVPKGSTIKQAIEELSSGFVQIRNKYGYIPIPVQQVSAESENLDHVKASKLEPSKHSLAESKLTYNDCDIALGIFSPQRHEIGKYRKYDIYQMGDSYRNLNVFKNRYGTQYLNIGLYFDGSASYFKELPPADQMNPDYYDLVKKRRPSW